MLTKGKEKREESGFQSINVLAITIAHHIHDIYTSFLAALQPTIIETFGINNRLFGLLSVFQRIPTLLNPFIGILAEKVRIRYLMILTPTLTAISMCLIGNVNSYIALAILVFVSGISSAIFHVPTPVMMKHISGNRTGIGMGFYMFGGEFARTVGPVIATASVAHWGFGGLYWLIPAGIVSSAILFLRFRNVDLSSKFKRFPDNEGSHFEVAKRYMGLLLLIALVTFVRGGIKSFFSYYLIGYLEGRGWENWSAAFGLSLVYVSGTAGSFLAGIASDFIGRRTVLLISCIAAPALVFLFIFLDMAYPYFFLTSIGFFLLAPTPVFLSVVNTIKSKHVTFLNGMYMTSNFLMSALATMLMGFGLDFLDPTISLKISAVVALFAIPIVIFLPIKKE